MGEGGGGGKGCEQGGRGRRGGRARASPALGREFDPHWRYPERVSCCCCCYLPYMLLSAEARGRGAHSEERNGERLTPRDEREQKAHWRDD